MVTVRIEDKVHVPHFLERRNCSGEATKPTYNRIYIGNSCLLNTYYIAVQVLNADITLIGVVMEPFQTGVGSARRRGRYL